LFDELRSDDYAAAATAADVLGEIRPASPDTIAALKDALLRTEAEHLPDRRDLVALYAAQFKVNPAPGVALVFLGVPTSPLEQLETIYLPGAGFAGWGLRLRVIRALGRIGCPALEVFPLLVQECESQTKSWRFDAAVAAWRISGDSPEAITTFERGLRAVDLESRQFALARLSEIGPEFPKALRLLASGLQDSSVEIRFLVLNSLAALGTNAVPVLPAIEAMTNDRTFLIRIVATQALQAVQAPILSKGNP
jgi:HEAT repeat protein